MTGGEIENIVEEIGAEEYNCRKLSASDGVVIQENGLSARSGCEEGPHESLIRFWLSNLIYYNWIVYDF